jgi:prophage antirepressor-like protein
MSQSIGASAPVVFDFQSHEVRTITRDGDPWFVAADVCAVLDLKQVTNALRHLDDDEKLTLTNDKGQKIGRGGPQSFNIISESGLYALIQRSRKPEAKKFRKWVTSEVLPSIRKTGGYGIHDAERTKIAIAFALEASKVAAQSVIEAFVAGKEPRSSERYLLSMEWDSNAKTYSNARVKAIDPNAYIASLPRLAEMINESDAMVDSKEIVTLANACILRLSESVEAYRNRNRFLRTKLDQSQPNQS